MTPGRLITLEGGEGAGKSTQARHIADWLRARGRQVILSREPGGSALAEAIRELVLRDWPDGIDAQTEVLLMFAARAAHVHQTLMPALLSGKDVVCDRFVDSSYAYQGAGKGIAPASLAALEQLAPGELRPQLTLVLDLAPEVGLARARRRGDANRFEAETLEYMRRVRSAFLARAAAEPARCVVIDASGDEQETWARIRAVLEQRINPEQPC